jgi:hypothetical protein
VYMAVMVGEDAMQNKEPETDQVGSAFWSRQVPWIEGTRGRGKKRVWMRSDNDVSTLFGTLSLCQWLRHPLTTN